jgi:hypothetical protein
MRANNLPPLQPISVDSKRNFRLIRVSADALIHYSNIRAALGYVILVYDDFCRRMAVLALPHQDGVLALLTNAPVSAQSRE